MATTLKFNSTEPQSFHDLGGEHVCAYAGRCARCNRRVYGIAIALPENRSDTGAEIVDPDPRGMIPPIHALSSMVASEYDMKGPDVQFCWDCANEHGAQVYQECLTIARRAWLPIVAEVNS